MAKVLIGQILNSITDNVVVLSVAAEPGRDE